MPLLRTDWTAEDHDRLWEHFNDIGARANPELYYSGTHNLATSSGTLNGGTAAWGGTAWISRGPHNRVTLDMIVNVQAGGAFVGLNVDGSAPLMIPNGYRPMGQAYDPGLGVGRLPNAARNCELWYNSATGRVTIAVPAAPTLKWAAGHYISACLSWVTNDPLPTSTPGTPVAGV